MKRILCLISELGAGGAQRQMVGLASFLKEKGYDVTVAFYHQEIFYEEDLNKAGVPYVYLKNAERHSTRIFHVAKYIYDYCPDVVVAYLFTPCICASLARLFNRRFRLIVSERNTTQQTGNNERIRFNLFRVANYVVPNSYSQEDYIKQSFPFLSDKVVTIPNFVDLGFFSPPVTRRRRDIPEIMIAASIWASKNTLGFIEAVVALKENGYMFHCSWFGKEESNLDYYNRCIQRIKERGVEDYIELKEKTTKIKEHYQDADFFCLPSFYEGMPNVICEAMACGLPIVCSDVCDNGKYVKEDENGYLFDPNDISSIVQAFVRLLSLNDEKYQQMCSKSRMIAEEKLCKESFVNAYIRLIEG